MKSRTWTVLIIFLISIAILWFLCPAVAKYAADGHLPSQEPITPTPKAETPSGEPATPVPSPGPLFNYFNLKEDNSDLKLSMHVLEVDPANADILVKPVSSHETLFGYDYLSSLDKKWNALASVNGGFSHPNGLLGGLYLMKDELLTAATGQYPVLFMSGGKAFIQDAKTDIYLEGDGVRLSSFYYNRFPEGDGLYVFTPAYGSENRVEYDHLNAVISNGEVRGLIKRSNSYEIPRDGFLISAIGEYSENRLNEAIKPGMLLDIGFDVVSEGQKVTGLDWAYECGSWILRDGSIVVPESDRWVGTLTIRTPRTAVGIKDDGTMVFVVADGRQKGLSDGLSGTELAQKLLSLGIKDAAFLDGGASSEMIVEGRIVNSPSAGRERMIAVCFVVLKND